jgi:uncharacterized protein YjiS (DUF1127 family)
MAGFAHTSLTNSHSPSVQARAWQRPRDTLLSRLVATVLLWRRRIRERQALSQLTARELADFGASNADVYREMSQPFWRAPPPC